MKTIEEMFQEWLIKTFKPITFPTKEREGQLLKSYRRMFFAGFKKCYDLANAHSNEPDEGFMSIEYELEMDKYLESIQ